MNIKNGFKVGFGITIGVGLANVLGKLILGGMMTLLANDDEIMEKERKRDPAYYERLKKYRFE